MTVEAGETVPLHSTKGGPTEEFTASAFRYESRGDGPFQEVITESALGGFPFSLTCPCPSPEHGLSQPRDSSRRGSQRGTVPGVRYFPVNVVSDGEISAHVP